MLKIFFLLFAINSFSNNDDLDASFESPAADIDAGPWNEAMSDVSEQASISILALEEALCRYHTLKRFSEAANVAHRISELQGILGAQNLQNSFARLSEIYQRMNQWANSSRDTRSTGQSLIWIQGVRNSGIFLSNGMNRLILQLEGLLIERIGTSIATRLVAFRTAHQEHGFFDAQNYVHDLAILYGVIGDRVSQQECSELEIAYRALQIILSNPQGLTNAEMDQWIQYWRGRDEQVAGVIEQIRQTVRRPPVFFTGRSL